MIWRLHWFEWMFIVLLLTMISFMATAEEPCRADGDRVSCEREAFDKLMKKVVDARADRDKLAVKLEAVIEDRSDVQKLLEACVAKPPPEPVVIKPTVMRAVGPVVLGAVGAVALGVSVAGDFGSTGRSVGAVVGLLAVGGGIVWALP